MGNNSGKTPYISCTNRYSNGSNYQSPSGGEKFLLFHTSMNLFFSEPVLIGLNYLLFPLKPAYRKGRRKSKCSKNKRFPISSEGMPSAVGMQFYNYEFRDSLLKLVLGVCTCSYFDYYFFHNHCINWFVTRSCFNYTNCINYIHAVNYFSKHSMFTI